MTCGQQIWPCYKVEQFATYSNRTSCYFLGARLVGKIREGEELKQHISFFFLFTGSGNPVIVVNVDQFIRHDSE